jgi:streptogramin lyase
VYTSSFGEHVIYKTTPSGATSVFAGSLNAGGSADGKGSAARFRNPRGVAVSSDGSVFVGDAGNGAIRKISAAGDVTTVKSGAGAAMNLIIDNDDTLYFVSEANPALLKRLTRDGTMTVLSSFNDYSSLHEPRIARSPDGTFYMVDVNTSAVRRILANATEIVAGVDQGPGTEDGSGANARFDLPREIAFGPDGRLYLVDAGNHNVRVAQLGEPLAINAFATLPPRIPAGGTSTLQWTTTGASSARIDPGIGEVAVNGSVTVAPSQTTTYLLTVRGSSGESTRSATVSVGPAPPRRRAVQ